ncbi:hypothetical protein C8J56DRAFT_1166808 [Mycena floridula]|nr:hypothetical protein C8J56DRAFT_1166808 [Mycena floridula]
MLEGIGGNEVLCQLFRIVVEAPAETGDDFFAPDPDTHFLCLKAYAPFLLEEVESPWAILDMHVGELCNLDAPDWMGSDWNGSTVCFRQDRAQFALLFASMAFWEHNAQRPENVGKMLHWAWSLSGGTSLATIWTLQDMTRGPRAPQRNVVQSIRRVFVVVLLDPQGMKLEPQEIHETGMPDDRYKGLVIQAQNLQYPFTPPWVQYAVIDYERHQKALHRSQSHSMPMSNLATFLPPTLASSSSQPVTFHTASRAVVASAHSADPTVSALDLPPVVEPELSFNPEISTLVPGESAPMVDSPVSHIEAMEAVGRLIQEIAVGDGAAFEPISIDDWEQGDEEQPWEEEPGASEPSPPPSPLPFRSPSPIPGPAIPSRSKIAAFRAHTDPKGENSPDPFLHEPSLPFIPPTPADIHPNSFVYIIYLLVLWLHTQCHLPFWACNAILVVFGIVLRSTAAPVDPPMYDTLKSVLNIMSAEPTFRILPVCPKCQDVYPSDIEFTAKCSQCQHPLFKTTPTPAEARRGRTAREKPVPFLQFPEKSLQEQLAAVLQVPGIEELIEQSLHHEHVSDVYKNIFDGRICRNLEAPDVTKFFKLTPEQEAAGELRFLIYGVKSLRLIHHVPCPTTSSISRPISDTALPNLLLAGILPGPKEADFDQVQRYLRVLVNELLRLWQDGVVIPTPKFPNGRLVRVALVALVCDKPAAHKLAGFPARTNEGQRDLQLRYLKLKTNAQREKFVKEHATRWTELHRLPYFDVCHMVVIDPMHNLFLGVVKTHFYHIWVQQNVLRKTKELRSLHAILDQLQLPSRLGRLPSLIGEPAGGSLTADQWLVLATVVAPLAIPQLWEDYLPGVIDAEDPAVRVERIESEKQAKRLAAAEAKKVKALESARPQRQRRQTARARGDDAMQVDPDDNAIEAGALSDSEDEFVEGRAPRKRPRANSDEEEQSQVLCNLNKRDPLHFLKLSSALKILVADELTSTDLAQADTLICEYCSELLTMRILSHLYGPGCIRPNHHYVTHTSAMVENYGPLREFWTFLFECLNKVLKSYKTPNHGGGELKTSFFREFHRTVQESRLMGQSAQEAAGSPLRLAVETMYKASADDRGTVQNLARDLDEVNEDAGTTYRFSPRFERTALPNAIYYTLLDHLQTQNPTFLIHSHINTSPRPQSRVLAPQAILYDYVVVNGWRYCSSFRNPATNDALIAVHNSSDPAADPWLGELQSIFSTESDFHPIPHKRKVVLCYGFVRWFRSSPLDLKDTIWHLYQPLKVSICISLVQLFGIKFA